MKKLTVVASTNRKRLMEEENDDIFVAYAKKHYFNPSCASYSEFLEDLKRIKYVKRLLYRFHKAKTLKSIKERLILNHLIVLQNVFGGEATAKLLVMKHEEKFHSYLKSFMVYMEFDAKVMKTIGFEKLHTDPRIDRKLGQITDK